LPVVFVAAEGRAGAAGAETAPGSARDGAPAETAYRVDSGHATLSRLTSFHLGRNQLAVPSWAADDRELLTARLGELAESFDFREPFERIREAIEEARRGG
jgi:hypothetical protein